MKSILRFEKTYLLNSLLPDFLLSKNNKCEYYNKGAGLSPLLFVVLLFYISRLILFG